MTNISIVFSIMVVILFSVFKINNNIDKKFESTIIKNKDFNLNLKDKGIKCKCSINKKKINKIEKFSNYKVENKQDETVIKKKSI